MHERTLKYFYEPGKLEKLKFFLDLTKCIAILKVCYMLREDAYVSLMETKKCNQGLGLLVLMLELVLNSITLEKKLRPNRS